MLHLIIFSDFLPHSQTGVTSNEMKHTIALNKMTDFFNLRNVGNTDIVVFSSLNAEMLHIMF